MVMANLLAMKSGVGLAAEVLGSGKRKLEEVQYVGA
jgi:hypothetical protein